MKYSKQKRKPGTVRDAIVEALTYRPNGATVAEIASEVSARIGETPASSVRSYLRLNTPGLFTKVDRGHYRVREEAQVGTLARLGRSEGVRKMVTAEREAVVGSPDLESSPRAILSACS